MIHGKLDIKILILYILSRLKGSVDLGILSDLCGSDDGVGYFDFADCLSELVETGHVEKTDEGFKITAKGLRDAGEVCGSLPFSVRDKADKALAPVAEKLERLNMISCGHTADDNGVRVSLRLNDGVGELLSVELLCPDEARAIVMEKNFRKNAEEYYKSISGMLMEQQ